jgi:hypothetical protein
MNKGKHADVLIKVCWSYNCKYIIVPKSSFVLIYVNIATKYRA